MPDFSLCCDSADEIISKTYFESLIYIASDIASDDLTMGTTSW